MKEGFLFQTSSKFEEMLEDISLMDFKSVPESYTSYWFNHRIKHICKHMWPREITFPKITF